MALANQDRVLEKSTTTGTGTYTLAGSPGITGFSANDYDTFASVGDGNTCHYAAVGVDPTTGIPNNTGWEEGIGTYTASGTTLARTTIIRSTNSNNAVNWSAGTRFIFISPLSSKTANVDFANVFTVGQTVRSGADGTIGLIVEGNSTSQSAKLLECRRSAGGAVRFSVDPTGFVTGDDGFGGFVLKDSSANTIFRGIVTNAWVDSVSSTFFQIGASTGKSVLCGASGTSFDRFGIDAIVTQIGDVGYANFPVPTTNSTLELDLYTAETNTITPQLIIDHKSAGTAAAGFGTSTVFRLSSSTTNNTDAVHCKASWTVATHASRTSQYGVFTVTNAGSVVEVARFDGGGGASPSAGNTGLMLWDVDNGTLERVTVGAADSGGTGYKVLRIPN